MTELADALDRLRRDLVEEATPLPGSQLAYGRPHEHPRNRSFPHYSKSGRRIEGKTVIGPDCPRPVRGRCECPPDGSWRPAVGVIRADATAGHAVSVPAERLRPGLGGEDGQDRLWVADVYEKGPDGLWRCRWPTRAALERQRGASPRRWAVAIALLRGDELLAAWDAVGGPPPNPEAEAYRIVRQIEAWAAEDRTAEWERRPRQWWDPPRKPKTSNDRTESPSESQAIAEHGPSGEIGLRPILGTATLPAESEALDEPRSDSGPGARPEPPTGRPAIGSI